MATRSAVNAWAALWLLTPWLTFGLSTGVAEGADGGKPWQRYQRQVGKDADIIRYYTFDTVGAGTQGVPSVAGESQPLTYTGPEPFQLVEGRRPGTKAVRIDRGWFQAKPFELKRSAVTVEIWFRKHGQGTLLGNGRTNGMFVALGNGYWEGLRLWTGYPARELRFELGRPKPLNAFGLTASGPVPDGLWQHLVATWDGQELRIYLDGILLASTEYSDNFTPTAAPLKLGYANAGIGSLKLDVDELAIYGRALSASEIFAHAQFPAQLPGQAAAQFLAGTHAIAQSDWVTAAKRFQDIVDMPAVAPALRASVRLALAHALQQQNRHDAAVSQYATVFEAEGAPASLRELAARRCLPDESDPVDAVAPAPVYERLLQFEDLAAGERIAVRRCLAERYLMEDRAADARKQYQLVLQTPDLPEAISWNVRFQLAHASLQAGDYAPARAAYAQLASQSSAPPEVRVNALLCIANTYVQQKDYPAARAAFAKAVQAADVPAHLRREAEERMAEMQRREQGLPPRDPRASRVARPPLPEPAVTFFVAPNGNDSNPGNQERPFASLQAARDSIRKLKAGNGLPKGGVTVFVRGGLYRVVQTLELTDTDSGRADAPIVYCACANEAPRFTGGVQLRGFAPVTDSAILARLPKETQGRVVQLDLKRQGITDYGKIEARGYGLSGYPAHPWVDLYVNGRPMTLARWPNDGFVTIGTVHQGAYEGRNRTAASRAPGQFEYDGDRPTRWQRAEDIWLFGYWGHLWAGRSVPVAQIDTQRRRITTGQPSSYGYRQGRPYYVFNLLEELDQPGEWYLDRQHGVLYLFPPVDLADATVELSVFSKPFVTMENVNHVVLRGLTFETGRVEGAVISDGSNNLLAGCTFRRLGTNGLIVRGGSSHGVLGCDIHCVGAGGARIAGGDRKTLTPGKHFIENCHIRDFTRIDRVYAPAVHLDGVGNRIAHNLFHESPHHAMRVEGYEHVIELNEIHSVVYESDDQAGIDIYGNPAYRGLVIRYNFWHHIGSGHNVAGQAGIRLDDFISAVLMYGNVFYRSADGRFGAVQIHGGKDNIVDNNLFIDCKSALSFSPWGQKRWLERLARHSTQYAMTRSGVDVTQPPHLTRYPDLAQMKENADRNYIWRNLVIDCGRFSVRDRGVNEKLDNHLFRGDPGFADRAKLDFSLPDDSPVYRRFGFRPIPFAEIGPYEDPLRASWPIEHEVSAHYRPVMSEP